MDINSVFKDYTREELIQMLWKEGGEVSRLKTLLTTAGEELYRLGSDNEGLLAAVENGERKWLPSYSIGGKKEGVMGK